MSSNENNGKFTLYKDLVNTITSSIGQNKNNKNNNIEHNDNENKNMQKSVSKDNSFKSVMENKHTNELKYLKKKKGILKQDTLTTKEKKNQLRNLSKKLLKRNSFYNQSGFNIIGKSLKKGLNENRLAQRENISDEINNTKTKILNLKYKLLYGFLNESDIENDFVVSLEEYKKLLKKRQNIDFLNIEKNKDYKKEVKNIEDELKESIEKYSKILEKDKEIAIKFYIEEIIPKREELLFAKNRTLEMIEDPNNKKIQYLYKIN
ncbi:hypothetical protein CL656_07070 [bacterium]|nr:hypothetical protein [bacterium]